MSATAPYNFVPLPPKAVPAEFYKEGAGEITDQYRSFMQDKEKVSGVIDIDVKTLTPCFIGGFGEEFFAPAGRLVIPGSTMRGMIKNLLKIVTCGAMRPSGRKSVDSNEIEGDGDFFDHKLYFRTMADKNAAIRKAYTKEMVSMTTETVEKKDKEGNTTTVTKKKGKSNAKAGFLIRYRDETEEENYAVCPAAFSLENDSKQDYEVPNTRDEESKSGNHGSCVQWHWDGKGVACFVGEMPGKKHFTIHHSPDWEKRIPVSKEAVMTYQDDTTRDGVNLLHPQIGKQGAAAAQFTGKTDVDFVVPCFYVENEGVVKHFGFGRYYRIPYNHSIGEHIPEPVQQKENPDFVDFADAIFGRKEDWGSRIFFDDCVCEGKQPTLLSKDYTHVLSSPNPTSFQLYLDQNENDLQHWNSDTSVSIRGYKLYWHRSIGHDAWRHRPDEPVLENAPQIAPVPAGTQFHGKIRFERLSAVELGALLKIFSLADGMPDMDICFKLGTGKSLGMGSVKINAALHLIGRETYTSLFSDKGWNEGKKEVKSIQPYTQAFDQYLKDKLPSEEEQQAYQEMLETLRMMLDWKNTSIPQWDDKTAQMESEVAQRDREGEVDTRFKDRAKLPLAKTVLAMARENTP